MPATLGRLDMRNLRRLLVSSLLAIVVALGLAPLTASAATNPPPGVFYVTERFAQAIAKVTVDSAGHATVDANFVKNLPENGPDSVIFDHAGKMLISNTDDGSISRVDPGTGQVLTAKVNLITIPSVADLALNPTDDTLWAIRWDSSTLAKVSLSTGVTVLLTSDVSRIGGITFAGGRLFVSSHDGFVAEIDQTTGLMISGRKLAVAGSSMDGMTFDPTSGHIFAAGCDGICEFAIGSGSAPTISRVKLYDSVDGDGIAADGHGHILVAGNSRLKSLDLATNTAVEVAANINSADDVAPVVGAGAPPAAHINLAPTAATHTVGQTASVTATVTDINGNPVANASVKLQVTGANPGTVTSTTNSSGQATFSYSGTKAGSDTLVATSGSAQSNSATVVWVPVALPSTGQPHDDGLPLALWFGIGALLAVGFWAARPLRELRRR